MFSLIRMLAVWRGDICRIVVSHRLPTWQRQFWYVGACIVKAKLTMSSASRGRTGRCGVGPSQKYGCFCIRQLPAHVHHGHK